MRPAQAPSRCGPAACSGEAHAAQKGGRFVRSNTFSTWALSLIGLAVFWLGAGSLTAETVRLHPFLLLFSYQLYYFSAGLFAPQGNFEVGPWALRRARVLLGLYAACGLASLALYALCGAPGTEGPAVLAAQFLFGLGTAPFGGGLLWLVPSTLLAEFLFVLLRRTFPGNWFLLFACGLVSLGTSMAYGLPGQVAYGADGALRYLIYYALGAVAAAFVQKQNKANASFPRGLRLCALGAGCLALALAAFCFWFGTGWATGRLGGQFLLVQACNFVFALMGIAGMALVTLVLARLRLCAALGRAAGAVLGLGGALALCADTAAAALGVPRNAEGQLVTLALSAGICALCAVLWHLCRKKLPVVFGAGE